MLMSISNHLPKRYEYARQLCLLIVVQIDIARFSYVYTYASTFLQ